MGALDLPAGKTIQPPGRPASDLTAPRRSGRPSREQAAERDRRLLTVAGQMFEARGFEGTTIDALAEAAGVGKPTVYARFQDKNALFLAIFQQRLQTLLGRLAEDMHRAAQAAIDDTSPTDDASGILRATLRSAGTGLLRRALTPDSIAFHRLIVGEAERFPELAHLAHETGWSQGVSLLADLLRTHRSELADPDQAADLFLSLVLGRLQRALMLGLPALSTIEIEQRVDRAVEIFLHGIEPVPQVHRAARTHTPHRG